MMPSPSPKQSELRAELRQAFYACLDALESPNVDCHRVLIMKGEEAYCAVIAVRGPGAKEICEALDRFIKEHWVSPAVEENS